MSVVPEVAPGQLWRTPFCTFEVEVLEVYDDGDCAVRDSDSRKIGVGCAETLRELWNYAGAA